MFNWFFVNIFFRLQYEKNRDLKGPLDKLEKKIKEDQKALSELEKRIKGAYTPYHHFFLHIFCKFLNRNS